MPDLAFAQAAEQGKAEEAVAAKPAEKSILPIPVDQIGVAAERTKRRVAELDKKLETTEDVDRIEQSLPEKTAQVQETLAHSAKLQSEGANLVIIDQIRQEWRVLGEAIDDDQSILGRRAAQISELRDDLSKDYEVWEATRSSATETVEGREVTTLIDATIAELVLATDTAKRRQGDLAALQGKVAQLTEAVAADVEWLMELRRGLVGKVFEQDRPAAWSPDFYQVLSFDSIKQRLIEHRDREVDGLVRFARLNRDLLVVHLMATLALIPLMFSARARIRRIDDPEDESVAHMQAVFQGPIALALLLSTFVGYWGYDDIPPLASPVLGVTFLLPAILLLRRLLDPPVFPILNLLLLLFFIDRLIQAIAPLPGLPRIVFIAEMIMVFVVVSWWQRPSRLASLSLSAQSATSLKWLGLGLKFATLVAPLAVLAEAAGYTALARTLGRTMLGAGYAAVILYGAAKAIDGLVACLLRVRPLRLMGMVQRHRRVLAEHLEAYTRWLMVALYIYVLLRNIELVDQVRQWAEGVWSWHLPFIAVGISIGSILEFLIVLRLTFALSKFIQFVLDEEVYTRMRMPKGQPYSISTLTHYTVLTIGFFLALLALGLDVNRFTVLAGAFGVGIGFGLQTVVNNFVSGIILLTERPVQVGDTVELEGAYGEVQRIGIRSSTVRTWRGAEVIVPNAQLISEQVTNWTLSDDKRRIEVPVGVKYGTDPTTVLDLLRSVAGAHPAILEDPAPSAFFMAFGDSALEFELRCWTDQSDRYMGVRSEIVVAVEAGLREVGISVPFPQRDLHLRTVSSDVEVGVREPIRVEPGSQQPGPTNDEPERPGVEPAGRETRK